jgi:O-antigen ligase
MIFGAMCIGFCLLWRLLVLTPSRLMLGVGAAVIGLALLPSAVWERALNPENYLPQNSYNLRGRFELWKGAWGVIQDYWMTGVGGANWWILPKYIQWDELHTDAIVSHNEYLQTFVDSGILGWLFFMSFVVVTLLYAVRTARRLRHAEGEGTSTGSWWPARSACSPSTSSAYRWMYFITLSRVGGLSPV